jgi:hypothetical protein
MIVEEPVDFVHSCSHANCAVRFTKRGDLSRPTLEYPMNDEDKHYTVREALAATHLFCTKHTIMHADAVCMNANITYCK